MVVGSIASLKVAVTVLLTATPVAPQTGIEAVTIGWATLQPVQSEHPAMANAKGTSARNHNHLKLNLDPRMAFVLRGI
jgi:hypothetical protein